MNDHHNDTYYRQLAGCGPMSPTLERARAARMAELQTQLDALRQAPDAAVAAEAQRVEREYLRERRAFIRANLRLVVKIAARYTGGPLPLADLVQEGNLGLLTAVDRFDHTRGVRFCTYAAWWIRHRMMLAMNDLGRAVRVPGHVAQTVSKLNRLRRVHESQHGVTPDEAQLAKLASVSRSKVRTSSAVWRTPVSLETASTDDARPMRDMLVDGRPSCHDKLERSEARDVVSDAMRNLPPIEEAILRKRFAFDEKDELTLREIGERHNLSRERIRQLQNRGLRRMRQQLDQTYAVDDVRASA